VYSSFDAFITSYFHHSVLKSTLSAEVNMVSACYNVSDYFSFVAVKNSHSFVHQPTTAHISSPLCYSGGCIQLIFWTLIITMPPTTPIRGATFSEDVDGYF
jgi:hypothetical protein